MLKKPPIVIPAIALLLRCVSFCWIVASLGTAVWLVAAIWLVTAIRLVTATPLVTGTQLVIFMTFVMFVVASHICSDAIAVES